jgi:phenylalanyl-tRNA synthetase alpha chain
MTDINDAQSVREEALQAIASVQSKEQLEEINIKYLGRKGKITSVLRSLKDLPPEKRKEIGAAANKVRAEIEQAVKDAADKFKSRQPKTAIDPTLPGKRHRIGAIHPITKTIDDMCRSFRNMGFTIARGPEVETDYYNFEALNFPPDHPARDMQDTFYIEGKDLLLRTHTTSVQARFLENCTPPVKIITPGRTYRHEAITARAYTVFHQVDGFMVGEGVTMADLKAALVAFSRDLFGEGLAFRMRPSYFPFTEPSAEVDITCFLCGGKGCRICKYIGWLEILGCGMIDPNVLECAGIDPEKYTGHAFGIGVERVAMLKYGIQDIRLFYENDIRFTRQFI